MSLFTGETAYKESPDAGRMRQVKPVAAEKETEADLSGRELAFKEEIEMLRREGLLTDQEYSYVRGCP